MPTSDPADASLADLLFRLTRRIRHRWFAAIEPLGLNPHQARAMRSIDHAGDPGARPTDIAERLRVTPRSATEVIDALVTKGLAEREPDPEDRRAIRVRLTEQGRLVLAESDAVRAQIHDDIFAALGPADRATMLSLLTTLDAASRTDCS